MKIIPGPFKDYYDHIAHLYGGGDPKVTYHRRRIGALDTRFKEPPVRDIQVDMPAWSPMSIDVEQLSPGDIYYRISTWLVVCGKAYPLVTLATYPHRYEIFDASKHAAVTRVVKPRAFEVEPLPNTPIGLEVKQLVELSRKVGHPVFILYDQDRMDANGGCTLSIRGDCPILGALGLATVYPAEQLYQDLAYFLVNTMQTSPDLAPPEKMTDLQKVGAHGFDKKVSFRHRQ